MDTTQTLQPTAPDIDKVPMDELFTDEYLERSEGGKVKAILRKKELIDDGGYSPAYRERYFAKFGMETAVKHPIKSGDINFYNVMALACRGVSKRNIAAQTSLAERSIEKIIYGDAGQAFLRATLEESNTITCSVLPSLCAQAYSTLEDAMQGKASKIQLEACNTTLALLARLEKMAAVTVDYSSKKSVTVNQDTAT